MTIFAKKIAKNSFEYISLFIAVDIYRLSTVQLQKKEKYGDS